MALETNLSFSPHQHHHAITSWAWLPSLSPSMTDQDAGADGDDDMNSRPVWATASRDATIRFWRVPDRTDLDLSIPPPAPQPMSVLQGHCGWVTSLVYIDAHQRLVSGAHDKRLKVWDPATGRCVQTAFGYGCEAEREDTWCNGVK